MKNRNSCDKIEKLIKFNMHVQYHCSIQACSMLAWDFQFAKFQQCWHGI